MRSADEHGERDRAICQTEIGHETVQLFILLLSMKFFDGFAGIAGFALPLTQLGHECVGFSEIEPNAIKVYRNHFPNHQAYGDITTITAESLPDFDLLTSGFPCQAF